MEQRQKPPRHGHGGAGTRTGTSPRPGDVDDVGWQLSRPARAAHAAIALLAAVGLATSIQLGWTTDSTLPPDVGFAGGFDAGVEHTLNQPAYFTVLSGFLVCLTSGLLAARPHRTGVVFHALRLGGVVCMVITGAVFNLLLRSDDPLVGVRLVNDTVLHVILPIAAPLVWLVVGPHGRLNLRTALASMIVPLSWLAVTLVRGPLLDWYPYEILDVPGRGYAGVGVYVGSILAAYLALALLLTGLDRLLATTARRLSPRSRR